MQRKPPRPQLDRQSQACRQRLLDPAMEPSAEATSPRPPEGSLLTPVDRWGLDASLDGVRAPFFVRRRDPRENLFSGGAAG